MTEYQGYQGGILQMTTLEALDHVLYYVAQTTDTDCYQLENGSVIDLRAMAIKIIELRDLIKSKERLSDDNS